MGMFDYVKYEANCEQCGTPLKEFQSKDGDCTLSTIEPEEVNCFYTSCDKCGAWNEFHVERDGFRIARANTESK